MCVVSSIDSDDTAGTGDCGTWPMAGGSLCPAGVLTSQDSLYMRRLLFIVWFKECSAGQCVAMVVVGECTGRPVS